MPKSGKVWGETEEIFDNGIVSIHFLSIKKGGYCSKHWHQYKSNRFHVIQGKLQIEIWQRINDIVDTTILSAGETCCIPALLFHRFKALSDVLCYEIYEAKLTNNDIHREGEGGVEK